MTDIIESIKDKKLSTQKQKIADERHNELLKSSEEVQKAVTNTATAIIKANSSNVQALAESLGKKQPYTQNITQNAPEGLKTALNSVSEGIQSLKNLDTQSDVVAALESLEQEVKDKEVEVTNLDDLGDFFFSLEQKLDTLDLSVNIPATDLKPVKDGLDSVKKAVQAIKMPTLELKDFPEKIFEEILEELEYHREILAKILNRPMPVGSGSGASGGGSSSPSLGSGATVTSVSGSASSVSLLSSNSSRVEATITNDSTADLYVKLGTGASTTSYTVKLSQDESYITDKYSGAIYGIWSSATGNARVTEVA